MADQALIDLNQLIAPLQEAAKHSILKASNGREYLFSHYEKDYKELNPNPPQLDPIVRYVSTVDTLAKVVKEEALRAGNDTGEQMTILLDDSGATYTPNDRPEHRHHQWRYARATSQQWQTLADTLERKYSSIAFYEQLLKLSPSIVDSHEVLPAFRNTKVSDNSEFTDQNHFAGGDFARSSGIAIQVRGKEGDLELRIPDEITFRVPAVRGSSVLYDVKAFVKIGVERQDDKTVARFGLSVPTLDLTKEQLLLDEAEYLASQLKSLPRVLIGMNYGKGK